MALDSGNTWGSSVYCWYFLVSWSKPYSQYSRWRANSQQVRLDGLHILHSLDGTNGCRHIHRLWCFMHLPSMLQLPGRLLPTSVSRLFIDLADKTLCDHLSDCYSSAASTVAANIILRSSFAAGFPLFSKQMFANLGVQWAGTLLGCLAAIMIPIPLAFRAYGPWLRGKSKLAPWVEAGYVLSVQQTILE